MIFKKKYNKLKKIIIVFAALIITFFAYVEITNRNSVNMTYRQKVLKAIYPAFVWWAKLTRKNTKTFANEKAAPAVSFYTLKDSLITGTPFDFTQLKGKSLNDPAIYKKLMDMAGNVCAEGLILKVQIAAYRKPENYKYDHLAEFGKPEIINYPDGITRFTQLQFTTLKDAEKARQQIIAKGQTDAWITGFVNGKRYTLEELIVLDFFGKSVN